MESNNHMILIKQGCHEAIHPDSQPTNMPSPHADLAFDKGPECSNIHTRVNANYVPSPLQATKSHHGSHSISISMPSSTSGLHIVQSKTGVFSDKAGPTANIGQPNHPTNSVAINPQKTEMGKFCSQSMAAENSYGLLENQQRISCNDITEDRRFDSFKTCSGRLERQLSNLCGKRQEPYLVDNDSQTMETQAAPAIDRYFDALEGPELDTLRVSEVAVLPEDKKWPFLLRFPISSFGMCLGVSSQAILWKTLAMAPSTSFLRVSLIINLVLWCISLKLMAVVSLIYALKVIFYFEAVRREYYHPIRVNFFFAPSITCFFLALGAPPSIAVNLQAPLWYFLMVPIFCLDVKIYGQWMSGGKRRLSNVANPSNHLTVAGNFVGALLGASMGLKEGPIFFFAIGLAHYIVLFVTLYQRLPTNATLPKELHPVFFLFVAAASLACTTWAKICGKFDYGSRIAYFLTLFLLISLAVRINFFRGFRFSLAWWAYTFPLTGASLATISYSNEVTNGFTRSLSVGLSLISSITVTAVLVSTMIHAFVLRDLFPNDVSIAISVKRPKSRKLKSSTKGTKSSSLSVVIP